MKSVDAPARTTPARDPIAGRVQTDAPRSRAAAFLELTKPGITRLVVVTAAAGFYLAQSAAFDVVRCIHALIGIGLAASGANALNMFVERDADRRMHRTARRPLPSGRLTTQEAVAFAGLLSALGVLQLLLFVNTITALVVALSLASYVLVYTPLKRVTWAATLVGAVPGALPILAGWTAGGGPLDASGVTLFGIVFFWQMPHFFALAWMYRDDYVRGGFRMLSADDPAGSRTARQIVLWSVALLAVSLLPATLGLAGPAYLVAALLLGLLFLGAGATMMADRSVHRARRVFLASVLYLPLLLGTLVIDKAIG